MKNQIKTKYGIKYKRYYSTLSLYNLHWWNIDCLIEVYYLQYYNVHMIYKIYIYI